MIPRIEQLTDKKLVGKRLKMSLTDNKTTELWRSFMPRRKEICNSLSADLFSIQVYDDPSYFNAFDADAIFEKWAAMTVSDFNNVPDDMETFELVGGQYVVFDHKGASTSIFQYIFGVWLPNSKYFLDNRPHFELLGARYKNDDPNSQEAIWIPVIAKK